MKAINLEAYGKQQISFYLALEEYLSKSYSDDVFFLWDLNPSIIIGKNQLLQSEINMRYSKLKKIPIFRRPSGGGAIYADEKCFMFSFITKEINCMVVYQKYLQLIIDALKKLNITINFSGRNDLLLDGKKISGNAIYKTESKIILHGTFLYDTDLDELVKVITPDSDKFLSKGIKSVKDRVINIKDFIDLGQRELMRFLINNIGDEIIELNEDEYKEILVIEKKYLNKNWIYGHNPPYTYQNEKRFSWGKMKILLDIKNNKIMDLNISGDFMEIEDIGNWLNLFKNEVFIREKILEIIKNNPIDKYILGCNNKDIIELLLEGEEYEENTTV